MADNNLNIEIDDSEIRKLLKEFPKYKRILVDKLEEAMSKSLFVVQGLIQGRTPVGATGNLRQSFVPNRPVVRGQAITGSVTSPLIYALPVERGRRPGSMPPVEIDGLELWVRRKLGISGDEARATAFTIARRIKERGTKGKFMVEQAAQDAEKPVNQIFDAALQEATRKIEWEIVR